MALYAFITEFNPVIMSPYVTTFPRNTALVTAVISAPLIQKCHTVPALASFFAVTFGTLQRLHHTTLCTHVALSQIQKVRCCAMEHYSEIHNCPSSCKTMQTSSVTTLFTEHIQLQL